MLDYVKVGRLYPLVPVASVDGRGVVRVPCPRCGRVTAGLITRRWARCSIYLDLRRHPDRSLVAAAAMIGARIGCSGSLYRTSGYVIAWTSMK